MNKLFFEVFPDLNTNSEMKSLLSEVEVLKVVTNSRKDHLRIYLHSTRLIHKTNIFNLEKGIKDQLFKSHKLEIKIIEKYHLSDQYNPQKLMDIYKESILEEFREYSPLAYNVLRCAKMEFPQAHVLQLTLEDSVVAAQKAEEIVRILEKIICERCGLDFVVHVEYEKKKTSKFKENSDIQIANEVHTIIARSSLDKQAEETAYLQDAGEYKEGNKEESRQEDAENSFDRRGGLDPIGKTDGQAKKVEKQPANGNSHQDTFDNRAANYNGNGQNGQSQKKEPLKKDRFTRSGFYNQGGNFKKSDNPDVIFGRDFEEVSVPIEQIAGEMGELVIRGKVLSLETRAIRDEKTIIIFSITDFTDTIMIKIFSKNEMVSDITAKVKKGAFLKVKGVTTIDRFDGELTVGSVTGIKKISDFSSSRSDTSPQKRVELHCHTKMSDMDGVSDVKDIIKRAMDWGHTALAITDHGVVQAFPDANHAVPKDADFKVIYGVEAYLVDDLKAIVENVKMVQGTNLNEQDTTTHVQGTNLNEQDTTTHVQGTNLNEQDTITQVQAMNTDTKNRNIQLQTAQLRPQTLDDTYVVFDLETTGFSPNHDKIIEIGAVKVSEGKITDRFSSFVNPDIPIPFRIEELTGINDGMVLSAPKIEDILPQFLEFCKDAILVAHNASFDMSFIQKNCERQNLPCDYTSLDTVALARVLMPGLGRFKLDTVAKALNVSLKSHHRAVDDADCTAKIFLKFRAMLFERDVQTLEQINQIGSSSKENRKKLPAHHAIILAKNDVGRVNLYRLVSLSHLEYFYRKPRIPKSEYLKYKEGLIIGSACEAGELYQAVLKGSSDKEIARLVDFYDYLEIQPLANNFFMLRGEKALLSSEEELREINRKIVTLGTQFNKPVVAACDVHFIDPEDEIYRRIIMAGKKFKETEEQPPLFLRTTEEMLFEFSYLGSEKAEEVVITNTIKIAEMCEKISPVRSDKCPPAIENSEQELRDICYKKAYGMYGEKLPELVVRRLEHELNSIISNGFAVMYIIAQKLVWKSNEDGYLVGSRGSVGSSFAATMAGITEVNPLPPHYYCKKCHFSDFDSEEVAAYEGMSGCDMPDRKCPICGEMLKKEGFDIPFETFLGFKGNKEPDIDLNFSGEYQSKAHKYTEVIFGEGQTFRAGTIGTLADKTAFGYVKNYYEDHGVHKRNCEISRIVEGCVGVRRTSGQHPGGIIVLPFGEEIYSFTPVQHPANDMTTDIITTHFDYHSIDHNLLKLDILGHDDPTMIRMLEDLTGIDAQEIQLDDPTVMSLFQSTKALKVSPEDIGGCPVGALGIPEFGTEFVIQMLLDTKPKTFSDLIRISGLSHGTDVWIGNAQTLIQEGKATISTAICTRDDIMAYLIRMGMESELAFDIMESVRKGKGLKEGWEKAMLACDVPKWYIDSCKKIKYMFPKAHAAAYVMMAWRIAYFKIWHPLAYYAAFFSIRATSFNYELMCQGKEKLQHLMADYERHKDTLSKKEQDTTKDMKVVQEMYARGFEFVPIDIYKAKSRLFQIMDGKLMPSLSSLEGLGDKAADAVVEAAKEGKFLSKDDFRQRTKVSKTVIDVMGDLGLLKDLPESNQLSLFDF
ncbi:PolC-type DNA polymerase III [Lachnospiraceae bacterium ZAX-1]